MVGRIRRPCGGKGVRRRAQPSLPVAGSGGGKVVGQQRQEPQAALPVGGVLGGVERREGGRRDAFALHLVEQLGEAVGEIEDRGAGGEVRLGAREARHQPGELELAAERRHRRRQIDRQWARVGELGDDADPRQEPRRAFGQHGGQGPGGAAGVGPYLDARHRLGRLAGEAGLQPGGQRAGEIDARGQREHPRSGVWGEKRHRARLASASAMPSGRPTSTQAPGCTMPRSRSAAISASQTGLSENTVSGTPATAAGSMICAPA